MVQKSGERKKNLEELRCLAMMMVVALHFLGKGELLGDVSAAQMDAVGIAAWVPEALCIVAVNLYMLISGYLLCESSFKLSRLLKLYLQIWMYSVGVGLIAGLTGLTAVEIDTHYFLSLLFPVSMGHYWFMTAYVFLYLLLPFVGMAVKRMTKEQLKLALIILLLVFCVLKSVLPFRLEEDGQGYDCLWYLCVFLTAAYIRRFGIGFLEKRWRCMLLYIGGCAAVLAELFVFRAVYLRTGSLGLILKISLEYNHIFAFFAAVGLFGWFL
ncbi:MAG: acyltransferase, partial [Acetatifactor sp.]|nr:acyltransferase [Acetatifactor sp.]